MGIGFDINHEIPVAPVRTLDVTIVRPQQQQNTPQEADFLANTNQHSATDREVGSQAHAQPELPPPTKEQQATQEPVRSDSTLEEPEPSQKTVSSIKDPVRKDNRRQKKPVKARKKPDIAQLLASTRKEVSRLTLEMDENTDNAANRPRRKAINANTREYVYASYLTTWRKKVERIGNLNYPDEVKSKKLYGDLLLHVAVRADGTVQTIRVVHSSGHKILDDAAVRIVRLAAPFAPFPPEIRKQVDILDITRTWQFLSNNKLFSGK